MSSCHLLIFNFYALEEWTRRSNMTNRKPKHPYTGLTPTQIARRKEAMRAMIRGDLELAPPLVKEGSGYWW
jgi:hypothetical protein